MDNEVMSNQGDFVSPPEQNEGKGFSITALVLGVLGIVGSFIPFICYFTLVCAILGIIFGVKGRKMSTAVCGKPSGIATAGFVLGIVGTSFAAIGVICISICGAAICAGATSAGLGL